MDGWFGWVRYELFRLRPMAASRVEQGRGSRTVGTLCGGIMSKRALRLHQLHSREELIAMQEQVKSDPENLSKEASIHLYNQKARKPLDDIGWAIYWHGAPQGNKRMQASKPQGKWW